LLILALLSSASASAGVDPSLFSGLHYRLIGPFRGGRTVAVTGVPQRPGVFYMAATDGGVWKTDDYGLVWKPIFDSAPTGSVGALAVAPSNPDILYVGSGEGLLRPDLSVGNGVYKSVDSGKTWTHLGLSDGQKIQALAVDPKNPDRFFVAVVGHPYGPNSERGVFRSLDGGKSFEKVLYKDENTGAIDVAFDPGNAQNVYASLWTARRPPWTSGGAITMGGGGLYKSTDGGSTWRELKGGLPTAADRLGRIGIGVAPSDPRRVYVIVEAQKGGGLYRSDDGGETFQKVNAEDRVTGRAQDFAGVTVDPKDAATLYVANTSTYRSKDGGKTFKAIKGAPGGDDYHTIWVHPDNPRIILLGCDQGATLSVNGGETWSSWYNQPTAQFYHVSTDNRFPYWVYGGQQESGSAGTTSRSDYGMITFRDWHTVGVEEYGYVAPDPLNPNIVYGGKVTRFNHLTGEVQDVSPGALRSPAYRFNRTAPLLFSPTDPHVLYLGSQMLLATRDGGHSWTALSEDLTRNGAEAPPNLGPFAALQPEPHRGVIYTIAPSPKDGNLIWVGTDDGLIQLTQDGGKTWKNVTPSTLTPWSKVSILEASHFDPGTAYAAINRLRLDDLKPHVLRTRDFGASWTEVVDGLPEEPVNAVHEDPQRKGLLFAGTENSVQVSFDEGDHWQSLQLDLPHTSVRDLTIHGDDLVLGTHGRAFWILDDITRLRQLTPEVAGEGMHLFTPQDAYRVARSRNTDTPLPPETPAGENPPDGVPVEYLLKKAPKGPLVLEIRDDQGRTVRRFTSDDPLPPPDEGLINVPTYWIRPTRILSKDAGAHRFVWDLHYKTPALLDTDYPISAIPHDTPREPLGPFVLPGRYTASLSADGATQKASFTVRMDPRVEAPAAALERQHALSQQLAEAIDRNAAALASVRALRKAAAALSGLQPAAETARTALDKALAELDYEGPRRPRQAGTPLTDLPALNRDLGTLLGILQGADAAPTTQAEKAVAERCAALDGRLGAWKSIQEKELKALDLALKAQAKAPLGAP
jgi:photosystem II stability/assembly factor-like uncharacterized protein